MSQPKRALRPPRATPIGRAAALLETERGGVVFLHDLACFEWGPGDEVGRRWAAVELVRLGAASRLEVAAAFGVHRTTIWRWIDQVQVAGVVGLRRRKGGPKGPSKLTSDKQKLIRTLASRGHKRRAIADRVGVSIASVRLVLLRGERGAAEA